MNNFNRKMKIIIIMRLIAKLQLKIKILTNNYKQLVEEN